MAVGPAFRDSKEKLPIKNDEESSFVDKRFEISNQILVKDMVQLAKLSDLLLNLY